MISATSPIFLDRFQPILTKLRNRSFLCSKICFPGVVFQDVFLGEKKNVPRCQPGWGGAVTLRLGPSLGAALYRGSRTANSEVRRLWQSLWPKLNSGTKSAEVLQACSTPAGVLQARSTPVAEVLQAFSTSDAVPALRCWSPAAPRTRCCRAPAPQNHDDFNEVGAQLRHGLRNRPRASSGDPLADEVKKPGSAAPLT